MDRKLLYCYMKTGHVLGKQDSWSPYDKSNSLMSHDASQIILICSFGDQETSLIIINVENSCAAPLHSPKKVLTDPKRSNSTERSNQN